MNFVENQAEEIPSIVVKRTGEFYQAAKELSEFIHSLPLSAENNNRLIDLMVDQVCEAERGAFVQGFRMGREFDQWEDSPGPGNGPFLRS